MSTIVEWRKKEPNKPVQKWSASGSWISEPKRKRI